MKQIAIVDIETSGLSAQLDWILQLSAIKIDRDFNIIDKFDCYIKPDCEYTINPDAQVVHGLTKEFIDKNGQSIKKVGPEFLKFIEGCDIAGYNSNNFDILRIYKDFSHAGLEFPFENMHFYDVYGIEKHLFPRNLESVYKKYTGKTMEEAGLDVHNSMSDVLATKEVFKAQMKNLSWDEVNEWSENQLICPDGSVRDAGTVDGDMLLVFNIGKYKDKDVFEIMKTDVGYMKWASKNMFSAYTNKLVRTYCRAKLAKQ